ncbi:papain-like cysteine peptidase [Klebsiella quasipneumoniae]|uniref:papain-like cysteine peptidase n=1 Tax=Klebsiella TaxID=570 RepID=UPI00210CC5D1|nr:papain-like cysteine peptidase [Klebsiella quasipneumoniae]
MADDIQKKYLKILLIKSTYKTLLGRPADPDGLKNYYHAISDKSLAESAQLLNASLMNSDEFKGLTPSRMAFENVCIPPHPVSGTETQGQWAVKHIVSLGSHCLTSWTLKKFNLKKNLSAF